MTFVAAWSSMLVASDLLREGKVSIRPQWDCGSQCPRVQILIVNREEVSSLTSKSLRASC